MGFEKKNYLQFYNTETSSYEELPSLASGIYLSFNEGDIHSDDPAGKTRFSGIKIPIFKTSQIVANPVLIGQLVGSTGPAVNIGQWQRTESPYSIRETGDGPEIAIGSSNFLISGRENMTMGNFNMSHQSRLINIYGRANYADNSNYIWMFGAANYVSGIYLSNILGKNNNIFAKNDLESARLQYPKIHSGYETYMVNVIGDYNNIISGGVELNVLGNYNACDGTEYGTWRRRRGVSKVDAYPPYVQEQAPARVALLGSFCTVAVGRWVRTQVDGGYKKDGFHVGTN
jgi:hypothetical protein